MTRGKGSPCPVEKAVYRHEEDVRLLHGHVEYRTGHSESRRARRLVISFVVTVMNYEDSICPTDTCPTTGRSG